MINRRPYPTALFSVLMLVGFLSAIGCKTATNEYVEPPPPEVTVTRPLNQPVTFYVEENGTIEASEEAEVRSRVRGFIEEIVFQPGQAVKVGDVLYLIEKDQYEAERNSAQATLDAATAAITVAEAQVKTAEAELARISREFERQKELIRTRATSQAEYDTVAASYASARADVRSTKATVDSAIAQQGQAKARLAQAQLDFDYTVVRAPIAGMITKTDVKKGNLVENGTVLATVVDNSQVFVNFNLSDREMLRYRAAMQEQLPPGERLKRVDLETFKVYLHRETDQGFPFEGRLNYVDEEGVESRTGTLAARALFENPDEDLIPGLFVRIRLPLDQRESLLVLERSVSRDQRGSFVLTVGQGNKVERRSVKIGRKFDEWVSVVDGLTTDDLVIVEGLQRARPDTIVAPQEKQFTISDQSLIRGLADEPPDAPPATGEESAPAAATEAD